MKHTQITRHIAVVPRLDLSFEKAALQGRKPDTMQAYKDLLERHAAMEGTIDPPQEIQVILTRKPLLLPR